MLHITNGDNAGSTIEATRLGGTVLPWLDVLHEGPVPTGLSLEQLRGIRAAFIADQGWVTYERALGALSHRDETILRAAEHDEVLLWFEHDLYDQLQLIQVLSVLPQEALQRTMLIQPALTEYLGQLPIDAFRVLYDQRKPVSASQRTIARHAWEAFRSPDPTELLSFLHEDTSAMPSVAPALMRHCQQYPWLENGLSRSERQILESLANQPQPTRTLYVEAHQNREELIFMGDAVFATYVQSLSRAATPLLSLELPGPSIAKPSDEFWGSKARITSAGRAVLGGEEDMVRLNGIDRWLGGVYLEGKEAAWRWDEENKTLRARGER